MSFKFGVGNQFWKQRSRHGVHPKFPQGEEGAQKLREACEDYFEWCENNPLYDEKVFSFEGSITTHDSPKLRAFTIAGLCIFIDLTERQWREWRTTRPDLLPVVEWAEQAIRDQKFIGAAAGFLNPTIISRDLGLADKSEISGPGGGPIQSITGEMTPAEAADLYAQTREGK